MKTSPMFVTGSLNVKTPVRSLKVKTHVKAGAGGLGGGGPGPIGPGG